MMLGNATMLLWDTDDGRDATAELLQAITDIVPEVRDRALLLKRIGMALTAQHNASYIAGAADTLIRESGAKP